MRRSALARVFACLLVAGIAVSGCSQEPQKSDAAPNVDTGVSLQGDFTGAGEVAGALNSANRLSMVDRRLRAASSLAARIEYTSTSGITGGHTNATGTVFVPKGKAPEFGWPIVAYGHGTLGIESECAPSLSRNLSGLAESVTAMVRAGFLVVLPDYQGLGLDETYHPYLDPTTAGYNMVDSVRAARKLVPEASFRWVAVGSSQGGQAAWAANELAADYGGGIVLLGTASLSAPLDIVGLVDAAEAGTLTKEQQPVLQLILAAAKNEDPDFNLDDYRRGVVEEQWDALLACQGPDAVDRANAISQINADDLRPSSPEAVETLRGRLQKMSLPQGPTVSPMLVVYGGEDTLFPAAWTDIALAAACSRGDVIDIRLLPGEGRDRIDVSMAFSWIAERFKDLPAANSCESFLAARAPSEPAEPGVEPGAVAGE